MQSDEQYFIPKVLKNRKVAVLLIFDIIFMKIYREIETKILHSIVIF